MPKYRAGLKRSGKGVVEMTKADVKGTRGFKTMNGLVAMLAWRGGMRPQVKTCPEPQIQFRVGMGFGGI
jgi:hypothetical protein